MSFTKFANIESILEVKSSANRLDVLPTDPSAGLAKFAALKDDIQEEDGYLYVRCRAISSRVNKNNDGWPSEELESAYRTFLGRPIFVDHNNENPDRTRGVIVSSVLHKEDEKTSGLDPYYATAPDNHKPPTWIELLLEVDAKTYPKLADAIRNGDIDAVSMGANIDRSVCSVCANEAVTPSDYCSHIKQKGVTFEIESATGEKVRKKAYEDCHGINFFEISAVFDPADTTALISEKVGADMSTVDKYEEAAGGSNAFLLNLADDAWFMIHPGYGENAIKKSISNNNHEQAIQAANALSQQFAINGVQNPYYNMKPDQIIGQIRSKMQAPLSIQTKHAAIPADSFIEPYTGESDSTLQDDRNYEPQDDQVTAPQQVDTLRDEHLCPTCKSDHMRTDPDGIERCPTCGYVQEPEPLNNPDLSTAKDTDLRQMNEDGTTDEGDDAIPVSNDDTAQITFEPIQGVAPVTRTTKERTSTEGINDMDWKVQLETTSRAMVDKVLPARAASSDTTIRYADGIGFGTHVAFRNAGIEATVRYPVDGDNTNTIPGNPLKDFMLVNRSMKALGADSPANVPVKVTSANLDEALEIIHEGGLDGKVAAKRGQQKTPLLPGNKKATDEPTKVKVVADQLKPVESKLMDLMERVAALGDDMEKNADRRHIKREEREEDGAIVRSEEIVEESGDEPELPVAKEEPATEESDESSEESKDESAEETANEDEREPVAASVDPEKKLLSIFALADDLVELGVVAREEKMAFVAKLEEESDAEIAGRTKMLSAIKEAGLTKKPGKVATAGLNRIPRLSHSGNSVVSTSNGSLDSIPDEAIFGG